MALLGKGSRKGQLMITSLSNILEQGIPVQFLVVRHKLQMVKRLAGEADRCHSAPWRGHAISPCRCGTFLRTGGGALRGPSCSWYMRCGLPLLCNGKAFVHPCFSF